MWSAGTRFFCGVVLLLCLLGDGIAHLLHHGVELGGVVLIAHHVEDARFVASLLRDKVEDSKLFGELLEFCFVLCLKETLNKS